MDETDFSMWKYYFDLALSGTAIVAVSPVGMSPPESNIVYMAKRIATVALKEVQELRKTVKEG